MNPDSDMLLFSLTAEQKMGKTWREAADFPTALFFLDAKTIPVIQDGLGYTPAVVSDCYTFPDSVRRLEAMEADGTIQQFGAIVYDDTTVILDDSMPGWRDAAPVSQKTGNADAFYPFNQCDSWLLRLRLLLRRIRKPGVLSFHASLPEYSAQGVIRVKGRCKTPSVNTSGRITAVCPGNYVLLPDPTSLDPWWPVCFLGRNNDPEWLTGDRFNLFTAWRPRGPANFREAMRIRGYVLPRLPGLEWQDDWAAWVDEEMHTAKGEKSALESVVRRAFENLGGADPRHVQWAIQDGIARYGYRAFASSHPLDVFNGPQAGGVPAAPIPAATQKRGK